MFEDLISDKNFSSGKSSSKGAQGTSGWFDMTKTPKSGTSGRRNPYQNKNWFTDYINSRKKNKK